jgi:glycosyltransferase involved in cell wall biosynthesis
MTTHLASLIAPCRNERDHIDAFVQSVWAQRLSDGWSLELLVADGQSDDGTGERLHALAQADARLHVVANPGRIVSTGLNACLAQARGEVIVRMDVHTTYAPDYVSQCLAALQRSWADNVGGPWVAVGDTPAQRAIAAAFQSRWVVGGARSRDVHYEGAVETVYLGCWPRATFERFGVFDEQLVRNQDDEHSLRITLGGGRIWQSAAIRSEYRPRGSVQQLFAQQRQYGYWRPFVLKKHGRPASWRQLAPAAFLAALCGSALLAVLWSARPLLALSMAYAAYLLAVSTRVACQAGWGLWLRLPWVVTAYHLGYGLGTWHGLWHLARGVAPSTSHTQLTR